MNFNFGKVFRTKESGASNDALKVEEALEASTLNTDENAIGSRLSTSFPTVVQSNFALIDSQVQKLRLNNTKLKANFEQAIDTSYQSPSKELKSISQSFDKTLTVASDTLESLKRTAKILQQLEEALSATPPLSEA